MQDNNDLKTRIADLRARLDSLHPEWLAAEIEDYRTHVEARL